MSKHTPGPWQLSANALIPHSEVVSPSGSIALIASGREENRENAHLIAAAPELLAACEALLVADDETDDWIALERALQDDVIPLVRAAIAKARGGER